MRRRNTKFPRALGLTALLWGGLPWSCAPPPETGVQLDRLSEHGFFEGDMAELKAAGGVLPYEVASPLFSDHAEKHRFLVLPPGEQIRFSETEPWQFPQGTTLIKSFGFREDLEDQSSPVTHVETRLLVNEGREWKGYVYLWNESQTEAVLYAVGKITTVRYADAEGVVTGKPYVVPNTNQCKGCHSNDDRNQPIGPTTAQLNRTVERDGELVSQLAWLSEQGVFASELPPEESLPALADPTGVASLEDRARSWLDANCAHCHRPGGDGGTSGLILLASEKRPSVYGVCKRPVAAGAGSGGFHYDIVPGQPERSIMVYRIQSTDADVRMPEIPNLQVPDQGLALVSDWITTMDEEECTVPGFGVAVP